MNITVGSLEKLEALYKASFTELVRKFSAKKVGTKYLVPINNLPWVSIINLEQDYKLFINEESLCVSGIKLRFKRLPLGLELIIGFLIELQERYIIVGICVTSRRSRFKCRAKNLNKPVDLWDFPKSVALPEIQALVSDVEPSEELKVKVPRCSNYSILKELHDKTTCRIAAYINLTSMIGQVYLSFENLNISYEK